MCAPTTRSMTTSVMADALSDGIIKQFPQKFAAAPTR